MPCASPRAQQQARDGEVHDRGDDRDDEPAPTFSIARGWSRRFTAVQQIETAARKIIAPSAPLAKYSALV
jgi:hypothetical protein